MSAEVVFKAMADGTRRRIMQLVARQELSVSELVGCLSQPQSTISRHLKVLREAGLLVDRREANTVLYSAVENTGHNGGDENLHGHVREWVGQQELPPALGRRLDRVLADRQTRATEFFSREGHRWDQLRLESFGATFHLEALATLLPADWIAADIGTGTGYLLPTLAETFRKVIAVDPVPEMLDLARRRCRVQKLRNVTFRRGDLSRLPIQDGHVDLALAVLVLHHVPSPEGALGELFRITKPGGRLLIVEQRTHHLESFHERMHDRWWGFEPGKLAEAAAAAGFDQVRHRPLSTEPVVAETPELFTLTGRRAIPTIRTVNGRGEQAGNRAATVRERSTRPTREPLPNGPGSEKTRHTRSERIEGNAEMNQTLERKENDA